MESTALCCFPGSLLCLLSDPEEKEQTVRSIVATVRTSNPNERKVLPTLEKINECGLLI
jgi:hypothetical protein